MSSVPAERIAELLADRFATTPILTWRDVEGEHADALDAVAAAVAARSSIELTTHRVSGNEFGIKHQLYAALDGQQHEWARHLLYRTGEPPQDRENWLLDIEAGYGLFTADTTSILVHDLGLDGRGVDAVVADHLGVFDSVKRTSAVREHLATLPADLSTDKLADTTRGSLCAAALGLHGPGCHRLHRIMESLLTDLVDDSVAGYDALSRYSLTEFLWNGCTSIYGYSSPEPTVAGFATWLFDQAWRGWPDAANAARIDFERLRDDRRSRSVFTGLAERAQDDLNVADGLRADRPSVEILADRDVFPVVDVAVVDALAAAVLRRALPPDRIAEIVRQRTATTWFDEHANSYRALAAAADCLSRIESFAPVIADPTDGVRSYAEHWSAIDRAYRTFRCHLDLAETDLPGELIDQVEHRYVEGYQRPLAEAWQRQVDSLDSWHIPGITALGEFAKTDLPAKAKTLVIISDALRYEVGAELADRMNSDDWFSATIEPRLAPLPSFTQLGMASHLPHNQLELIDHETVHADGNPTDGLKARAALWATADVAALAFRDVKAMRSEDIAAIWSAHTAVVVYHDVIDAAGEKLVSEHTTPDACTRALDEIAWLIGKFGKGKARASRVLVTADHGFLFQASKLGPGDFLSEAAHGEQIVYRNKRYVLGRGLREDPAFTLWSARQLGLDGDLQVQIPRSLHRLTLPGGGVQFVHGGATLQEVVVPLVTLIQSRSKDTSKVTVDLNTSSPTITSSAVLVTLTQREPVTGKRRGRSLSIGVFADDGTLLSNQRAVVVDSRADDIRERHIAVELVLGDDAMDYNGQTVQIRADEVSHDTRAGYKSTSVTLQRGFGGFFDAL
ncbi:BREX-1 system phosphatase PglZ type A [Antrihabitans cavernicola]|uniref:BREX-1 system phosphatase PglZ type A n=1 Tax=Antrihabitans cavernicola TaxID=2495913 RepID=A0A5A7S9M8_9NOCA|nr:BREX-1 system phosphatase PglZ type A [Spelaeibacter cavernicola]KAA0021557.1 BREX-1 system phosphatase PglZ type A [Spelaeibacter cavernicola]